MATVGLPLTGAGDATAQVAVDRIGGEDFQRVKLFDATEGSTVPISAKATTPGATDAAMVVRPIGSTAFNQAVVGAVGITSGSSAVELTSAGSTRLVGRVTLENPTTSVSLSSQHTVTVGNPTTSVDLASGGSTKVIGTVNATGTTKVDVSSGVILGAGSSANILGTVALTGGSTANTIGTVQQGGPAASSDNAWWVRTVTTGGGGGSTTVDVNQASGSSAVSPWVVDGFRFSSAQTSASTLATSAESQLLAANAARRSAVISNLSTAVELLLGFTTAVVSTARANCHYIVPVNGKLTIGGQLGDVPLYTGPIRGRLNSTTLTGIAGILQFTT